MLRDITSQHRYTGRGGRVVDLFWKGSAGVLHGQTGLTVMEKWLKLLYFCGSDHLVLGRCVLVYSGSNAEGTAFRDARLRMCTLSSVARFS